MLASTFLAFRKEKKFCDMFFEVEGEEFDLHKIVLATKIENFLKVEYDILLLLSSIRIKFSPI